MGYSECVVTDFRFRASPDTGQVSLVLSAIWPCYRNSFNYHGHVNSKPVPTVCSMHMIKLIISKVSVSLYLRG